MFYGLAQKDDKDEFLDEFADECTRSKGAVVMGGDFNIIRKLVRRTNHVSYPDGSTLSFPS